ncbi:hypothetical protein FGB62_16g166 [Gracilaria domingensis]|nr:hypothetical protein FGB62_16g166 [Gracilaria domingensis]
MACLTNASGTPSANAMLIPPRIPAHVSTAIVPPLYLTNDSEKRNDDGHKAGEKGNAHGGDAEQQHVFPAEVLRVPEKVGGANEQEQDRVERLVCQVPDFVEGICRFIHGKLGGVGADEESRTHRRQRNGGVNEAAHHVDVADEHKGDENLQQRLLCGADGRVGNPGKQDADDGAHATFHDDVFKHDGYDSRGCDVRGGDNLLEGKVQNDANGVVEKALANDKVSCGFGQQVWLLLQDGHDGDGVGGRHDGAKQEAPGKVHVRNVLHEEVGHGAHNEGGEEGGHDAERNDGGENALHLSKVDLDGGGEQQEAEHVVEQQLRKVLEQRAEGLHEGVHAQHGDVAENEQHERHENGAEGHGDGGGNLEEVVVDDVQRQRD